MGAAEGQIAGLPDDFSGEVCRKDRAADVVRAHSVVAAVFPNTNEAISGPASSPPARSGALNKSGETFRLVTK